MVKGYESPEGAVKQSADDKEYSPLFVTPEAAESWADNEGLKDGEYTIDSVVLPASSEKMFDRYPQLPDWF